MTSQTLPLTDNEIIAFRKLVGQGTTTGNSFLSKAIHHMADSKTYIFLILLALMAISAALVADALFHHDLWGSVLNLFGIQSGSAAARAVGVDGVPKIAAAWNDPNSQAANPPAAVSQQTQPVNTNVAVHPQTFPPF